MSRTETLEKARDIMAGIAITGALFLSAVTMPLVSFLSSLFIPLPVMIYRLKLGRRTGVMIPAAMLVLIALILGRVSPDFFLFAGLMGFGFILGECSEYGYPVEKTIVYSCGWVITAGFFLLFFYSIAQETGLVEIVSLYIDKNLTMTLSLYEKVGMPEENIQMIREALPKIQYALVRIVPSLLISTSFVAGWANILIARSILMKKGFDLFQTSGPLNRWRAPEMLVWAVIGSGLMIFPDISGLRLVGVNGLIICFTIFLFQGIAVTSFIFEKKKFPLLLRVLLYAIIILNQLLLVLLVMVGFFDVWLNFRKLGPIETTEG